MMNRNNRKLYYYHNIINMNTNSDIIKVYVYHNTEKDCDYITTTIQQDKSLNLQFMFYAVNPKVSIRPPGMDLFCVENNDNTTTNISVLYDNFNIDINCDRFLAWKEPVPMSSPLYVWTKKDVDNGDVLYKITFHEHHPSRNINGFIQNTISPIFVLLDPRVENAIRIKNMKLESERFKIINDIPQFYFKGYLGRCIPSSNGTSIGKCSVVYGENIYNQQFKNEDPTLLNYIKHKKQNMYWILFVILILWFMYMIIFR